MTEKKKTPWWIKLIMEMLQPFSILLWIAAALCIGLYCSDPSAQGASSNIYLATVLIFIVLLTGGITFQQGAKSEALMAGFKNFLPATSTVIREGQRREIPAIKLVVGDILEIKMGEKIPADIRIIHSREMKVDNSSLTGEVEAQLRTVECTNNDNPLETKNLAFFGTLVKEGQGKGIVINIGDHTVMGQIADLATGGVTPDTPLNKELKRFVLLISCIAVSMGVVLFFLSLYV